MNQALVQALGDGATLLFTALRVTAVYVGLLLLLRLAGKRTLGQMTPFDLLTLLLLSNAVQNAMIGPNNSLTGSLLATALRREGIELEAALREHGVSRIEQVASAVLEIDGTISVVPSQKPIVHKVRHVKSSRNR